ncbi:hypothetical protein ACEPAI_1852 [Sanghuangporus weigelae]
MVVTRSMAKKGNAKNGGSDTFASSQTHSITYSTDAVVPGDAARGAVDKRASTCSKFAKSNSAPTPNISRKDKSARSYSRTNIPKLRTTSRHDVRKSTRTRKPSFSAQATAKKRGLKSKEDSNDSINKYTASTTSSTAVGSGEDGYKKEDNTRHPTTRGVKRKSDGEDNPPKSETGPWVNTRRIRRRLETRPDGKEARDECVTVIQRNGIHDSCPVEGPRRSSRLAAKSSLSLPHPQQDRRRSNRSRKTQCLEHAPTKERLVSRKQKCGGEQANDMIEAPGPSRRVRRRALKESDCEGEGEGKSSSASGISTESPQETLANESNTPDICRSGGDQESSPLCSLPLNGDLDSESTRSSPRGLSRGRHMSIESVPSAIWSEGVKTEPRSPSIESLMTPPPYIKEEEEEVVLINQDLDMMIPLDSRDAEEDRAGAVLTHLLQLEDEEPSDELLIEASEDVHDHVVVSRYRSLAPEPDQGLINAIRSGEIPGLASPPPSVHEAS